MDLNKEFNLSIATETLFSAWVSEEAVIDPVTKIECDLQVGGTYRIFAGDFEMQGQFQVIVPDERLEYT
jgi:hypothetical protein